MQTVLQTSEVKWAMICYVPVFNVIFAPLTAVRMASSAFCNYNSRQALVLFLLWFITILSALISSFISLILWAIVLFLHALGMFMAFKGIIFEIPVISKFAKLIPPYYLYQLLTGKVYQPETTTTNNQ